MRSATKIARGYQVRRIATSIKPRSYFSLLYCRAL
ncbi:MAG: hypothetical protein JWP08_281, partial [Bryobacterales bacterium]|nr:hypothetical protein [Bryobacterales bacterium]